MITLIPENNHVIGLDSKLMKIIGDNLSDIGINKRKKYIPDFNLNDFLNFRSSLYEKLDIRESPDFS